MINDDSGRYNATSLAHRAGARVSVELDWDAMEPGVEVRFTPRHGDQPGPDLIAIWESSVVHGVRFALGVVRSLPCAVRVTELCGDPHHTRPTLMAAAAASAVWEALEIVPPPAVIARVQALVTESEGRGPLWLADFGAPV